MPLPSLLEGSDVPPGPDTVALKKIPQGQEQCRVLEGARPLLPNPKPNSSPSRHPSCSRTVWRLYFSLYAPLSSPRRCSDYRLATTQGTCLSIAALNTESLWLAACRIVTCMLFILEVNPAFLQQASFHLVPPSTPTFQTLSIYAGYRWTSQRVGCE